MSEFYKIERNQAEPLQTALASIEGAVDDLKSFEEAAKRGDITFYAYSELAAKLYIIALEFVLLVASNQEEREVITKKINALPGNPNYPISSVITDLRKEIVSRLKNNALHPNTAQALALEKIRSATINWREDVGNRRLAITHSERIRMGNYSDLDF
jgi:MinD-like ATPase involved in chromosome partitioning or flagellar assembly